MTGKDEPKPKTGVHDDLALRVDTMSKNMEQIVGVLEAFKNEAETRKEKAHSNRVVAVFEKVKNAERESKYSLEKLKNMSDESLDILEESLDEIINEREKISNTQIFSSAETGMFNSNRTSDEPAMSRYEVMDILTDMVSNALGFPILDDENKTDIRHLHAAEGLIY
jgi:membrane-associated HD superfamily phosphohydrolase